MFSFLLVALAINVASVIGQEAKPNKCGTYTNDSSIAAAEKYFQVNRPSTTLTTRGEHKPVTINAHWHVIRMNETQEGGDIWDFVVQGNIDVMNYHFKDSGIQFKLVNVSRVTNESWFRGVAPNTTLEFEMKQALRQGGPDTLNIYSVRNEKTSTFGWATFPYEYPLNPQWMDGVVIRDTTVPGSTANGMNRGKTLVHETGHWCGLYHVFMNDCAEPGDYVDDTPPQEAQYECFVPRKSACIKDAVDPLFNIMDYTGDCCQKDFTPGQDQRMREQLKLYRGVDV